MKEMKSHFFKKSGPKGTMIRNNLAPHRGHRNTDTIQIHGFGCALDIMSTGVTEKIKKFGPFCASAAKKRTKGY